MASGGTRIVTGAYKGTGSALTVKTPGFRPKMVQLFNATGLVLAAWTNSMADGAAHKIINHASAQNVVITSNGITPLADGFQVGTDADLNTSAEIVHWVAHE
jgi:hypothetical protein